MNQNSYYIIAISNTSVIQKLNSCGHYYYSTCYNYVLQCVCFIIDFELWVTQQGGGYFVEVAKLTI